MCYEALGGVSFMLDQSEEDLLCHLRRTFEILGKARHFSSARVSCVRALV